MDSGEHKMTLAVDELPFALRITSPKHKNNVFSLIIKCLYGSIGKFFPPFSLVTTRTVCLHSEGSIEQKDTLLLAILPIGQSKEFYCSMLLSP